MSEIETTPSDVIFGTLRGAAESMRDTHPESHPRHEMWVAFATFLEATADNIEQESEVLAESGGHRLCLRCEEGFVGFGGQCGCYDGPLYVAKAYLRELA